MNFFVEDIVSFFVTIYGGLLIGVLFDINRAIKKNFSFVKLIGALFDVLFWLIVTVVSFVVINAVENFNIRYYHFVALFFGFLIYYATISKFVLKTLDFVISFFVNLILKTTTFLFKLTVGFYYILIYTIHIFYDFILFIPSIFKKSKRTKKVMPRINFKIKKKV